jgi:hypothetical protein
MFYGQGGFKRQFKLPGALNNTTKNVFETTAGNYLVCGIMVETVDNIQTNRLAIMGLNSQGQLQWTKKYGNSKFEYLDNSLIAKWFYKQGNFIYHAGCVRDSNNKYLGVLVKFSFNGDTIWQKRFYDSAGVDVIPQMVNGSVDGGFLITGFFQGNGYRKALLIKTDINGVELWRKKIGKTGVNVQDGKAIVQDSLSKKIITVGYQYVSGTTSYVSVLILDSLGNKLHHMGYTGKGLLVDVIQTKDKKIVAVGEEEESLIIGALETHKSFAVKFDFNAPATPLWYLYHDKTAITNFFTRATELANGNIILTGIIDTMQQNNLATNCLQRITKIDANGNILSNRHYDYSPNTLSDNNQTILSYNPTSDGGFISAFQVFNSSPNPFFIVKYDSTGCDSSIAYCQTVGLEELRLNKDLFTVYPNPTNGILNISFKVDFEKEFTTIEILNNLGQVIREEEILFKNKNAAIKTSELPSGVYLLNLKSVNSQTVSKRFVIAR